MVSTAGGIVIAVVVILLAAAIGWIVFTQLRARRLGLPPPSLSSYLPWHKSENSYGPPRPAPGGVVGWFNDQLRKFKNRGNRSATGAYEQPLQPGSGPPRGGGRGFGPLDPDEAWDTNVGHEADTYGYFEEQELGGASGSGAGHHGASTEYTGGSYSMNTAVGDEERGRRPSRSPGRAAGGGNPFDDDHATSLRGLSPRPMDTAAAAKTPNEPDSAESSPVERRSVFRENV